MNLNEEAETMVDIFERGCQQFNIFNDRKFRFQHTTVASCLHHIKIHTYMHEIIKAAM